MNSNQNKILDQAKKDAKVLIVLNNSEEFTLVLHQLLDLVANPSPFPNTKSVNFKLSQCIEYISQLCVQYNRKTQLLNLLDVFPPSHHLWSQYPLGEAFELAINQEADEILDILIPLQGHLELGSNAHECLKTGKTQMFRKLWPVIQNIYNTPLPQVDTQNVDPVNFIRQQQLRLNINFLKQQMDHFPFVICDALAQNLTSDKTLVQDICDVINPLPCLFYLLECQGSSPSRPNISKAIKELLSITYSPGVSEPFQGSDVLWNHVTPAHIKAYPKQYKALEKIILNPQIRHMFPLSQSKRDKAIIQSSLDVSPTNYAPQKPKKI